MRHLAAFWIAMASITPAHADVDQSACRPLESGAYPVVKNLGAVLDQYGKDTARGEFETSSQYATRMSKWSTEPIVVEFPLPSTGFSYDADTELVRYDQFTIPTTCIGFNGFREIEQAHKRSAGLTEMCLFKQVRKSGAGSFVGKNAYGAQAVVARTAEEFEGVFLGYGDVMKNPFGRGNYRVGGSLFELQLGAGPAKSLKEAGALLVVVQPKAPFLTTAISYLEPTINHPEEHLGSLRLLVGDVTCIALANRASRAVLKVLSVE